MQEEINEIIKKNLPAHVGEELQKVLAQAKEDADDLSSSKLYASSLYDENYKLKTELNNHANLDKRFEELKSRELDLEKNQRNMEMKALEIKLVESEKRADMIREFTLGLVRNVDVRKEVYGTKNEITTNTGGGSNGNPVYSSQNVTPSHYSHSESEKIE